MRAKDLVRRKDGNPFDKEDYYRNPEQYESKFYEYLPHIHFLIECIYWEKKFPRVLTK
jgi:hypothetical protein